MLPIEILYQKIKDNLPNKYQARIIKNYIVINTPFVNQMHDSIILTIQFNQTNHQFYLHDDGDTNFEYLIHFANVKSNHRDILKQTMHHDEIIQKIMKQNQLNLDQNQKLYFQFKPKAHLKTINTMIKRLAYGQTQLIDRLQEFK